METARRVLLLAAELEDGKLVFLETTMSVANVNWLLDRMKVYVLAVEKGVVDPRDAGLGHIDVRRNSFVGFGGLSTGHTRLATQSITDPGPYGSQSSVGQRSP